MDYSLSHIPQQFQNAAALLSGLLALSGLILWAAGIKVARAISAAFAGVIFAVIGGTFLPGPLGIDPLLCIFIGLGVGIAVGILAFRMLQGIVLAATCGVILAGAFYHWQQPEIQLAIPATAAAQLETGAGNIAVVNFAKGVMQSAVAWWQAVPVAIRQQMVVVGAGMAITAFAVALLFSKATTWVFTATMGATMFFAGGLLLLQRYLPGVFHQMPSTLSTRLVVVGVVVAVGMFLQYVVFWPRKKQGESRGEAAAAA